MARSKHTAPIGADSKSLTARPSGAVVKVNRLPTLTITRAIRFPFASLAGLGVTIIAYLVVESLAPG